MRNKPLYEVRTANGRLHDSQARYYYLSGNMDMARYFTTVAVQSQEYRILHSFFLGVELCQ